ncbi:hypothetical protein CJP74_05590 [Psittacicella melopsittaci]|uniref:Tetratricopeptide repeat protein n=1 Tax=Psittacicella melopsittaci TaxID=2028576 RepID=A0A3A1Y7G6_9GAMM|nr:DUF4810 domain-containing protein [Psittacicella melopsittaci]RIY32077.1 hypothetical protein CJP74_05590 [Psittacicella melopsittaci]
MRKLLVIFIPLLLASCSFSPKYEYFDYLSKPINLVTSKSVEEVYVNGTVIDQLASYDVSEDQLASRLWQEFAMTYRMYSYQQVPGASMMAGYALLKQGDTEKAIEYFNKEKEDFPESTKFINLLLSTIKK